MPTTPKTYLTEFYVQLVPVMDPSGRVVELEAKSASVQPPSKTAGYNMPNRIIDGAITVRMSLEVPSSVFEPLVAEPMKVTRQTSKKLEAAVLEIAHDLEEGL